MSDLVTAGSIINRVERSGFLTISVNNPLSRSVQDLLRAVRFLRRQERRLVTSVLISVDRPRTAVERFLPIRVDLGGAILANPLAFQAMIDVNLIRDENNPGSDSFIVQGGADPIPNFSRFDVVFGGVSNVTADPFASPSLFGEPFVILHRINPGNLNARPLTGSVKYPSNRAPWLFRAKDNSHDRRLYVDDGHCMDRVFGELKIPMPDNLENLSAEEVLRELYGELLAIGKTLVVVHPWQDYAKYLDYDPDSFGTPEGWKIIHRKKFPKSLTTVVSQNFQVIPKNAVVVLYDGDEHIALASININALGESRLVPVDNYYWGGINKLYYLHETVQARSQGIPGTYKKGKYEWVSDAWALYCIGKVRDEEFERFPNAYCFFDFETVYGTNGLLFAYSVSYMFVEVDANFQPVGGTLDEVVRTFKDRCNFYPGSDSADHLVDVILRLKYRDLNLPGSQAFNQVVGVTFNGSKFDHFLLYRAFLNYSSRTGIELTDIPHIEEPFWMGTSLVSFTVDKYFRLFDLRRHLAGSLDKCCKDFQTHNRKSSEDIPDHEIIQHYYESFANLDLQALFNSRHEMMLPRGKSPDDYPDGLYPSFLESLSKYNDADVTSLAELFFRYRANNLVSCEVSNRLSPPITLASETFSAWTEYAKPRFNVEGCWLLQAWKPLFHSLYVEIRSTSVVAGRTQCFHPPSFFKGPMVSMDVTSLYPYVMAIAPVYYPVGKHSMYTVAWSSDDTRTNFPKLERLGLFKVSVDQAHLQFEGLPYILASKNPFDDLNSMAPRNDWHSPFINDMWITSEEMRVLLKFNCQVRVHKMLLWEGRIRSIDLFGNLADLMKTKNSEDEKKKAKSPDYNPARRQAAKLASNALYGKMMEGQHLDKRLVVDCDTYTQIQFDADVFGLQQKYTYCSAVYPYLDDMVVDVKLNAGHKKVRNKQRPMVIGFFILAYARMYMYEHTYSKLGIDGCLYTDTDAIKCSLEHFESTLKPYLASTEVPHWPEAEEFDPKFRNHPMYHPTSKVYGAFENELEPDNAGLWVIAKKMWACVPASGKPEDWKIGTKGVTKGDIILTKEQRDQLKAFQSNSQEFLALAKRLYRDKSNTVANNPDKFFRSLLEQGVAYILKSDIKKHVTQLRRVEWIPGETPDHVLQHFSQLSQSFKVMALDPVANQEVTDLSIDVDLEYEVQD